MTGKKVFFDTAIFIYALEKKSDKAMQLFEKSFIGGRVGTSTITITEYCAGCFKNSRSDLAQNFINFLKDMVFEIVDVDEDVAMKAAEIRGKYPGLKTCDALQIASAIQAGADVIYTNDKQLLQYQEEEITILQM